MDNKLPRRFRKLANYVRTIANLMFLRDWQFRIETEPSELDTYAEIECSDGRKAASINFAHNFFVIGQEEQRQTVCHELLHAHLMPVQECMNALEQVLDPKVYQVFQDRFTNAMEYAVDGIADGFGKFLPMPNLGGPE